MNEDRRILTVSQVNKIADKLLSEISVWVIGEVDDYSDSYKSAIYFKLKDGECVLPCLSWKTDDIGYYPKNGEKILAFGTLSIYPKNGTYRFIISKAESYGEGELLRKREELRKKLLAQGYFDEEIKRKIPELPIKIGLITSKRGAAISDFKTNVVKGFLGLEIYFVDAIVQGDAAVASITGAFKRLSKEKLDVVVLTRGGGDIEDLMCFNTEEVVKAIRACPIPVISAVGHEVDYTLSDLAADLRVSTPTKAAELISGSFVNFRINFENEYEKLGEKFKKIFLDLFYELDIREASLKRSWVNFKTLPRELLELKKRFDSSFLQNLSSLKLHLSSLYEKVNALSPKNILKRGYSMSYLTDGSLVSSVSQVFVNDKMKVRFYDGSVDTVVTKKEK